jgi:hypothetical protein
MDNEDAPDDEMVFPPLILEDELRQRSKEALSDEDEMARALEAIGKYHPRIASALKETWGYPECANYLQRLIFNGSDPAVLHRAGFKPEVLDAILILSALHHVVAR